MQHCLCVPLLHAAVLGSDTDRVSCGSGVTQAVAYPRSITASLAAISHSLHMACNIAHNAALPNLELAAALHPAAIPPPRGAIVQSSCGLQAR